MSIKLKGSERITLQVNIYDSENLDDKPVETQYLYFTEIAKFHEIYIHNYRVVLKIINQINDK